MQKTPDHGFWEKIVHTNFKQSYLELWVMKSGPGGLDGKLEGRRIGWDSYFQKIESQKVPKMQNKYLEPEYD